MKREKVRAELVLSKKAPEKRKEFWRCDLGQLIKKHTFPARIEPGVDDLLEASYLKLHDATDKDELLDQVRSYAYSKGAMAGTRDLQNDEIAQIGRSADVLLLTEDGGGNKSFTVSSNTVFSRSVLHEYKEQDKEDGKYVSHYWDDEVEKLEPLFIIKFTSKAQLPHFKDALGTAEVAATKGYSHTRGTDQTAHPSGGWPQASAQSPDGLLMIIYRAVCIDNGNVRRLLRAQREAWV